MEIFHAYIGVKTSLGLPEPMSAPEHQHTDRVDADSPNFSPVGRPWRGYQSDLERGHAGEGASQQLRAEGDLLEGMAAQRPSSHHINVSKLFLMFDVGFEAHPGFRQSSGLMPT